MTARRRAVRDRIPRCAKEMACLCAAHARGADAATPCDTAEGPTVEFTTTQERLSAAIATFEAIPRNAHQLVACSRRVYDAAIDELRAAAIAALGWDPEPSQLPGRGQVQAYAATTTDLVAWAKERAQ